MGAAAKVIRHWPEESREAARLVLDSYGEPSHVSGDRLTWDHPGPWKRITATRAFHPHEFPIPHIDSVESVIDYRVPPDKVTPIVEFDGSVTVKRTTGEVAARCHDEQANFLALNLMHDIVTGKRSAAEARDYYAQEFLKFRRKEPTPYMERLHFQPGDGQAADADHRVLSDEELEAAAEEGRSKG